MTEETTTEQLVEIEGQAEDTAATEYTPPEGWCVLQVGERLRDGDMTVRKDGYCYSTERVGYFVGANQRYIRRIEPEPEPVPHPEPQPQPEPVHVREGRWRTRHGAIRNVTPTPAHDSRAERWPWRDAKYDQTWREDGGCHIIGESPSDLVEYLGPIEPQPEPAPQPHTAAIEELRSEVYYVQNLLGESRQRVTQLEELVASLRTINEAQEKAFTGADKQNDALRAQVRILQREADKKNSRIEFLETLNAGNGAAIDDYKAKVEKLQGLVDTARGQLETAGTEHDSLSTQLAAVKAELVTQAETSRRLQIELDAAQQVPQAVNDRFEEGWDAGTARAVETIAEWTEPFRRCGSERLAWMVMQNMPHIMRSLTGLTPED